jgi:hypothetical protein
MTDIPDLQTALNELVGELRGTDIKLIIGGGYGIHLKNAHVRRKGMRTLLREWPEARSTNDLDLFLRPELLIDSTGLKPLANALAKLGYQIVPGAEKYQFLKPVPEADSSSGIKIDILTGPRSRFRGTKVKADARRARPSPSVGIHAHPVDETPTLERGLLAVELDEKRDSTRSFKTVIYLPHPYTFSMMKLFAFRDRIDDDAKEFGRYHALDLYAILATTTEEEWESALELRDQYRQEPYVIEAGNLVADFFSDMDDLGMIRLRESPYFRHEFQLDEFMSALKELFPAR